VNFQRGKGCRKCTKDGECREMGPENKEVEAMPICYLLTFASLVFPLFSVFKVLYHEHPFAFSPSAMSVMP